MFKYENTKPPTKLTHQLRRKSSDFNKKKGGGREPVKKFCAT